MSGVPILVEAVGLRVLVVGAGVVATRKLVTLAEDGRVEWLRRTYVPADLDDAQLVIVATDDRAVNAMAAADALAMYRMVNVADAPADGSFTMMATHRSGDLVVGVSAGGVPGAAARIRDVIAGRFDERYARAVAALVATRRGGSRRARSPP